MPNLRFDKGAVVPFVADTDPIAKGKLVHLGGGRCGVAVNAVAGGAPGEAIVKGIFSGGDVDTSSGVAQGELLAVTGDVNKVVTALETAATATAGATLVVSNIRANDTYSASATVAEFTLLG